MWAIFQIVGKCPISNKLLKSFDIENDIGGNLLRIVPPQKKGDFLKFCFYSTLKVSNITLVVLGLKSNSWASSFLLTLSVIANYMIKSRRYLLLFFKFWNR